MRSHRPSLPPVLTIVVLWLLAALLVVPGCTRDDRTPGDVGPRPDGTEAPILPTEPLDPVGPDETIPPETTEDPDSRVELPTTAVPDVPRDEVGPLS